jgi:hypothetical protein
LCHQWRGARVGWGEGGKRRRYRLCRGGDPYARQSERVPTIFNRRCRGKVPRCPRNKRSCCTLVVPMGKKKNTLLSPPDHLPITTPAPRGTTYATYAHQEVGRTHRRKGLALLCALGLIGRLFQRFLFFLWPTSARPPETEKGGTKGGSMGKRRYRERRARGRRPCLWPSHRLFSVFFKWPFFLMDGSLWWLLDLFAPVADAEGRP